MTENVKLHRNFLKPLKNVGKWGWTCKTIHNFGGKCNKMQEKLIEMKKKHQCLLFFSHACSYKQADLGLNIRLNDYICVSLGSKKITKTVTNSYYCSWMPFPLYHTEISGGRGHLARRWGLPQTHHWTPEPLGPLVPLCASENPKSFAQSPWDLLQSPPNPREVGLAR